MRRAICKVNTTRLPSALLVTIGLQTLAAFVIIHLKATFFLEVTHV